jgi:hypothetical protein
VSRSSVHARPTLDPRFAPDAFHSIENTMIPNASIVVDGEPMNILVSPDEAPVLAGAAGGEVRDCTSRPGLALPAISPA